MFVVLLIWVMVQEPLSLAVRQMVDARQILAQLLVRKPVREDVN